MAKRTDVEWVGGLVSIEAYVSDEIEPFRPEVLIWLDADGRVLGQLVGRPSEPVARASESLRATIASPLAGRPHAPARVRVESPDLARALRGGHPGIEIVCAPTPELEPVRALMRAVADAPADLEDSYLTPQLAPEAVTAFFRAAAALFRAKPWKIVPGDQDILRVSIEALGVKDAALSVIGQMGQSLGLILFPDLDSFDAYLDAAEDVSVSARLPPHLVLNFSPGRDLSPSRRREIREHGWELAGANAHPWLVSVDPDGVPRPPFAREVTLAEAIARALPTLLGEKQALLAAWSGGPAVERTLRVSTHAGEMHVSLRAPFEGVPITGASAHELIATLQELARDGAPARIPAPKGGGAPAAARPRKTKSAPKAAGRSRKKSP